MIPTRADSRYVMPAKARIQARAHEILRVCLDSRIRGNDERGSAQPVIPARMRWVAAGTLLATLVACHPTPPPPRPVAIAPAVPHPPPPPEPVSASWSFSITQTACVARAVGREVSLTVNVGIKKVEFVLAARVLHSKATTRTGTRGTLRFHGGAGSWTWPARVNAHRDLAGVLPANKTAANNVLVALEGGTLRTEAGHAVVPLLLVPAANVAGRDWFECVAAKITHVDSAAASVSIQREASVSFVPKSKTWMAGTSQTTTSSQRSSTVTAFESWSQPP